MRKEIPLLAPSVFLLICISSCSKSVVDYQERAQSQQAANEPFEAEITLKEGIEAHKGNTELVRDLMNLYKRTERWDSMEQYMKIAPDDAFTDLDRSVNFRFLGGANLKRQRWGAASDNFSSARHALQKHQQQLAVAKEALPCPFDDVRLIWGKAAADSALKRKKQISVAVEDLMKLSSDHSCADDEKKETIKAMIADVHRMARELP